MKLRLWYIFLSCWTVIAGLAAYMLWNYKVKDAMVVVTDDSLGNDNWWQLFHQSAYPFYPCILLSPYVLFLCRRITLGIHQWKVVVPVFSLCALGYSFLSMRFVERLSQNTPSIVYVNSAISQNLQQSEFADELIELFKEGLSNSGENAPRIQKIENGGFMIMGKPQEPLSAPIVFQNQKELEEALRGQHAHEGKGKSKKKHPRNLSFLIKDGKVTSLEEILKEQPPTEIKVPLEPFFPEQLNQPLPEQLTQSPQKLRPPPWLAGGLQLGGFVFLAGIGHSLVYFRNNRDREKKELQLKQELSEASYSHLKDQIRPHFLFNSLNGISSHIHTDPDKAVDMVGHLGGLLRSSLEMDLEQSPLIRMEEELEILGRYLELQVMRFGERLQISKFIAPDSVGALIPGFILQPVAENIIRHVVEISSQPCLIEIHTEVKNDLLTLSITNTGVEEGNDSQNPGTGHGLNNIKARLRTLYGEAATLSTDFQQPNKGGKVTFNFPLNYA